MKSFDGFPNNMQFTPIPNLFMNMLMPDMGVLELKCMLFIFQTIYAKKGSPRYTSLSEIMANTSILASINDTSKPTNELILDAIVAAVKRKALISVEVMFESCHEYLYFLNTQNDRLAVERIRNGTLALPKIETVKSVPISVKVDDIFSTYEENIGILTPMISEELKDALSLYSKEWIHDAIREAVYANKRNWRYISRILERWISEGKKDGTYQQSNVKEDPDKYISGQYGHLIQR